jgi:hypothetical protein
MSTPLSYVGVAMDPDSGTNATDAFVVMVESLTFLVRKTLPVRNPRGERMCQVDPFLRLQKLVDI